MACRRADGAADRFLPAGVSDDRPLEARGTGADPFLSDQWDPDRRCLVRIPRRRANQRRGEHRRPPAAARHQSGDPLRARHLRADDRRHPPAAPPWVPFHVISVLSAESLAAPREMFDFYVAEGIDRVCFNVEESEGGHVSRSFGETGLEEAYYTFLREFWRLAAAAPGKFDFIREIDDATRLVLRPKEGD